MPIINPQLELPPEAWNPFATVSWRRDIVQRIRTGEAVADRYRESIIHEAVAVLNGERTPREHLIRHGEAIFDSQTPQRWELESRLLAGQTDAQIAEKCRLEPALVDVYELLFCGVRPFLDATDWLLAQTVGTACHAGFRDDQVREFWAWIALSAGSVILDELVHAWHRHAPGSRPSGLSRYLEPSSPLRRELQAQIALAAIPQASNAEPWFVHFGMRLQEMKSLADREQLEQARNSLLADVIECGRTVLAGKALPAPGRPRKRRAKAGSPQAQPGGRPAAPGSAALDRLAVTQES